MENGIINQILNNFDFAYIFIVNILTYILIKAADSANGEAPVPLYLKRVFTVLSIVVMSGVYLHYGYTDYIKLINSSIAAPVIWSWILRPVLCKLNLGYKQDDYDIYKE